jgi:7,8-dihydropterin-6-yl-methyl-4-(beta-D-ribofuranosyl)aminobenzene 5'-phosphate synthase
MERTCVDLRITILCENTAIPAGYIGEHGFSALIERGNKKIIFDTGQGLGLTHNTELLGLDLSGIDDVVLSHGHYDHTGGLKDLLSETGGARITAHPHIFQPKYARRNGQMRYIGIPFSPTAIEGWGGDVRLSEKAVEVAPGITTTGVIPRITPFEGRDTDLLVKTENGFEEDALLDDLSLIIDTPRGTVVLLGCAHAGLINILSQTKDLTGKGSFHWVLGGTHLGFYGSERLDEVIQELRSFPIENIGASHCTGLYAGIRLAQEMGDRLHFCNVGAAIEV